MLKRFCRPAPGLDCELKLTANQETFSSIPDLAESPLPSKVFQYYQNLHSIHHFLNYVRQNICVSTDDWCQARFATILQAKYLDLDYDTLSSVLTLSAYWDRSPGSAVWTETIPAPSAKNKVEVGILSNERPADPRELSIGGFLTVVGDDQKPSQTLFSFASRHHPLPARAISTFEVSFPFPTGLHPTFRITFPSTLESSSLKDSCSLNAYLTLPSYLFIDKYQLSDPVFLSSKNLEKMRSLYGEADLEAPDWIINRWGSNLLIEIAQRPHSVQQSGEWHADIPLHLRYLKPTSGNNGRVELNVPWPIIFWACPPDDEIDISVNPFDRANLGYDLLFPPNTIFHHLSPIPPNGTLLERLTVPSLDLEQTYYIEPGTVLVILAGFLWICLKLFKATQLDALASIKTSRNKLRAE
ncbi:MAG: protease B nonderepressible form [Trizodia sp. TS-e1964]|nr:MAG: protease B nonderepressible form [Trizodia sp. TS-e1964]